MDNFEKLFGRFLFQRHESLDWDHVNGPSANMVNRSLRNYIYLNFGYVDNWIW